MFFFHFPGTLTYCRFSEEQSFVVLEDDDGTPVVVSPFAEALLESIVELDIVVQLVRHCCPEVCFQVSSGTVPTSCLVPSFSANPCVDALYCLHLIFAGYILYICIVVMLCCPVRPRSFSGSPQVYCRMWKVYAALHKLLLVLPVMWMDKQTGKTEVEHSDHFTYHPAAVTYR